MAATAAPLAQAFGVQATGTPATTAPRSITGRLASTAETETDDMLKPSYEIEPIPTRIGHGFDIHRLAPVEEAGQPVVIGGVVVTHKDQKVRADKANHTIIVRQYSCPEKSDRLHHDKYCYCE